MEGGGGQSCKLHLDMYNMAFCQVIVCERTLMYLVISRLFEFFLAMFYIHVTWHCPVLPSSIQVGQYLHVHVCTNGADSSCPIFMTNIMILKIPIILSLCRWANQGLEFLILACEPRNSTHLSHEEFQVRTLTLYVFCWPTDTFKGKLQTIFIIWP